VTRPRRRRPSPRLPFVVIVGAAIAAAVVQARVDDDQGAAASAASAAAPATEPLEAMPAAGGEDALASTWYCAAGTGDEGGMADHTVVIFNPSDRPLTATVTLYGGLLASSSPTTAEEPRGAPTVAAPIGRQIDLPPRDRVELRLGDIMPAPLVAALVEVRGGAAAVEHRVEGRHGADVAACASRTAPVWYLATGATARDARQVMALFNPFPTDAVVDVSFETDAGTREPVRFQGFPVRAGSVVGVDVGDDVAREGQVSATVRVRTGRLVVERLQSFDGTLGPEGLAVALGVPRASTGWAFADGRVDEGRTEQIVLYNPGDERAEVEVRVMPVKPPDAAAPSLVPFRLSVRAGGYTVVDYGAEDRIPAGVDLATLVRSTNEVPVVAERILTHTVPRNDEAAADDSEAGDDGDDQDSDGSEEGSDEGEEGSDEGDRDGDVTIGPGASVASDRWAFASPPGRVVLLNLDAERPARVTLLAIAGGGAGIGANRSVEVPPAGGVALEEPGLTGSAWTVTADAPVVVERTVASDDGIRVATGPGIPIADGAVPLTELVGH
jgi:hypothetical protein